jgi:hypothetical protein
LGAFSMFYFDRKNSMKKGMDLEKDYFIKIHRNNSTIQKVDGCDLFILASDGIKYQFATPIEVYKMKFFSLIENTRTLSFKDWVKIITIVLEIIKILLKIK